MKKVIYNSAQGNCKLYTFGTFERFMKRRDDTDIIKYQFSMDGGFMIWHFPKEGVILNYTNSCDDLAPSIKVTLSGVPENISKIERMLEEASKK